MRRRACTSYQHASSTSTRHSVLPQCFVGCVYRAAAEPRILDIQAEVKVLDAAIHNGDLRYDGRVQGDTCARG